MISAKIILDSVSFQGHRLTTFQLRYPKFIHGEFMTHRVFSRNASSSRAVPTEKLLAEVRDDALRAAPIFWGKNQPGMQAAEELSDVLDGLDFDGCTKEECESIGYEYENMSPRGRAQDCWKTAALAAAHHAEQLLRVGAHKQIVNRLLEPFSHINVLCTATEYANFFGLRLDAAAQPEMRALAEAMWAAYDMSDPTSRLKGEWHLPLLDQEDDRSTNCYLDAMADPAHPHHALYGDPNLPASQRIPLEIRRSVARCARVSYLSNDTGRRSTVEEDLTLYDRLVGAQPLHASPAEHQATPDVLTDATKVVGWEDSDPNKPIFHRHWKHENLWGNFTGWCQYRKMLVGEARAPLPEGYAERTDP